MTQIPPWAPARRRNPESPWAATAAQHMSQVTLSQCHRVPQHVQGCVVRSRTLLNAGLEPKPHVSAAGALCGGVSRLGDSMSASPCPWEPYVRVCGAARSAPQRKLWVLASLGTRATVLPRTAGCSPHTTQSHPRKPAGVCAAHICLHTRVDSLFLRTLGRRRLLELRQSTRGRLRALPRAPAESAR